MRLRLARKDRAGPLIQVYRRDLGGGTFDIVKDAAAPIFVGRDHWGASGSDTSPAPAAR